MKKRLGMIILTIAVTASLLGCSKETAPEKEVTKEDDPKQIFEEAAKKLDKETRKAAETKSVTSYNDGTEEEEYYTCSLDTKQSIMERVSKDEDETGTVYHCFNVKEKDGYGVYVNDGLTGGKWKYYKENLEADEQSEYEYWLGEFYPAYTEENGYSNIKYSNEGEDELNGTEAIKIKVTADEAYDTGERTDEDMTRESVLKENGWSEEEVKLVDGFSKILDDYIAASNKSVGETTVQSILTVWIDAKEHTMLKSRSATNIDSAQDEDTKKALEKYNEEYWKVDMIHLNIEDGMSPEEAKKALEEDLAEMEQPEETVDDADEAGEEFSEEDGTEEYAAVSKVVVTKKFMTGKDCPEMGDLPKEFDKIKQEEYFEGGFDTLEESDDYFSEDEEFEDEFE